MAGGREAEASDREVTAELLLREVRAVLPEAQAVREVTAAIPRREAPVAILRQGALAANPLEGRAGALLHPVGLAVNRPEALVGFSRSESVPQNDHRV